MLRNLNFDVPPGGNLAILGGSGSGKSTLLKLIGGLDYPDRGKIRRKGTISWPMGNMRYERGMTINQNLRFICRVLGVRDYDSVVQQVQELTGFDRQMGTSVDVLRQPEVRSLSLAVSLCFSFDIMLMDGTPRLAGLKNKERYAEKLEEKMAQSALILATGNPKEITEKYPYILVLDGKTGRLYDKRQDAIDAFKATQNNAPQSLSKKVGG